MITVVINGSSYQYPETNDTDWGNAATQAFKDLTACTLQKKNAGEFAIENELSFGSSYGIKVLFISTVSNDPALSGVFRLANNELVAWRNGSNDGDNTVSFDASDNFVINGNTISFDINGEMLVNGVQVTRSGEIVNVDVAANAGIEESKLALDYSTDSLNTAITTHIARTDNPHSVTKSQVLTGDLIVNTDVDNSAAIVESKLSLNYSTSSLNSAITSHTGDTNNPHDTTVSNLDDTTITTPTNDDTLLYNGSKWVNTPNTVDNLKNVNITSVQNNDTLSYDSVNSKWINQIPDLNNRNIAGFPVIKYKTYFTHYNNSSTWYFTGGSYDLANQQEISWTGNLTASVSGLPLGEYYYFMFSPSHNSIEVINTNDCIVSNSEPTFSVNTCWFNPSTRVFKYGKGATSWSDTTYTDLSVPLALYYSSGTQSFIFNKIASSFKNYLFIYPGTSYVHPKGVDSATGYYLNEVEYLSNASNQMVSIAVGSTYNDNSFFVRNYYNGNSFSLIKENELYITDDHLFAGKKVSNTYTAAFSYTDNLWFTVSSGTIGVPSYQDYYGGGFYAFLNGTTSNIQNIRADIYEELVNKPYLDERLKPLNTTLNSHIANTSNPHSTSVSNLSDTTITTPTSGQVLTYDGSKWTNQASASASLSGLTDTNITTPSDQDIIVYDSNSTKWINQPNTIGNVKDVDITSATADDVLIYDDVNSKWINSQVLTNHIGNVSNPHNTKVSNLVDTTISTPSDKQLLQYDYANLQWVNSSDVWTQIEVNDIANINTANTNVTLTASDKRHQVFTATDGFDITLPSTDIKAGAKFIFDWTVRSSTTGYTNAFNVYASDNTLINSIFNGYFRFEYIAKIDEPVTSTDWLLRYSLNENISKQGTDFKSSQTLTANTYKSFQSDALISLCPAVWRLTLKSSMLRITPANDSPNGVRVFTTYNGTTTYLTYESSSNMVGSYGSYYYTAGTTYGGQNTFISNDGNLGCASPYTTTGLFTQKWLNSMSLKILTEAVASVSINNFWFQHFIFAELVAPIDSLVS